MGRLMVLSEAVIEEWWTVMNDLVEQPLLSYVDPRPVAVRDYEVIEYNHHTALKQAPAGQEALWVVENRVFDEMWDCEPAWTPGEVALDEVHAVIYQEEYEQSANLEWIRIGSSTQ
jgi:hypothetical protein